MLKVDMGTGTRAFSISRNSECGIQDCLGGYLGAVNLVSRILSNECFSTLLRRHQPFIGTTERQLNPERRGKQNIDFPRFNFLQIARGDFSAFGELLLRPALTYPFPTHVGAENLDALPFFFGDGHDILHRL